MSIILDGKGRGYRAAVTPDQRLRAEAVTIDPEDDAIRVGEGWQIAAPNITLTSDNPTALLFIKNNGDKDLVLDRAVLLIGSTDGTGDFTFQTLRNPGDFASDTILISPTDAGLSNSNHGSNKEPDAEYFQGVEGDTLTGGTGAPLPIQQASNRLVFPFGRRLPLGSSIGFKITPPTGNTSCAVTLVTHVYYDQTDA